MKSFIVCVVLATLAVTVMCDHKDDFMKLAQACMAETHVTETEMKNFLTNGMKPADANDNIKCQFKCIMEKQDHLKNGVFNEEAALKTLMMIPEFKEHSSEIEAAVKQCKNEKGSNDCDTAFQITMCLKANKAAMGLN